MCTLKMRKQSLKRMTMVGSKTVHTRRSVFINVFLHVVDAAAVKKLEKVVHTSDTGEEWRPVCHPRMPVTTSPRYFVNKQAVVCTNITGIYQPMKTLRICSKLYHILRIGVKKQTSFKLEEVMAYTFWEQPFDSSIHWLYYKDGNRGNCAWDNLIVCDLPTLQQLEITRLEKLNLGTKYTVVRNVHDTLTFERYLVSDAGKVFSLIRQIELRTYPNALGYLNVALSSDIDTVQRVSKSTTFLVHRIVIQSFKGRRVKGLHIDHRNGIKEDNTSQNLSFVTPAENMQRAYQKVQKTAREARKKQEKVIRKSELRPIPPIGEETRWKVIGVLPWNGRSFKQYEVSDTGHVRKVDGRKLLVTFSTPCGYPTVHMRFKKQNVKDSNSTTTTQCSVHVARLVAHAFVDGYSEALQGVVKHLNGDKQDNRAQNLKWVSVFCSSLQGTARQVVATLVDDSEARKKFPSIAKARRELSTSSCKMYLAKRNDEPYTLMVDWDGEKKLAYIQVGLAGQILE